MNHSSRYIGGKMCGNLARSFPRRLTGTSAPPSTANQSRRSATFMRMSRNIDDETVATGDAAGRVDHDRLQPVAIGKAHAQRAVFVDA